MNIAVRWYNKKLTKYPILTKSLSGSLVFLLGDLLCQYMEKNILKKDKQYDMLRAMKQASFGLIVAPYLHLQYNVVIPRLFPEFKKFYFVKSVAYAILISDAIFNFSFFCYMGYAKNGNLTKTIEEIPEKFIPVQITNIQVFPWLTGFNFYVMPMQFRVLFDNFLSIFWNIYLSYVEHK